MPSKSSPQVAPLIRDERMSKFCIARLVIFCAEFQRSLANAVAKESHDMVKGHFLSAGRKGPPFQTINLDRTIKGGAQQKHEQGTLRDSQRLSNFLGHLGSLMGFEFLSSLSHIFLLLLLLLKTVSSTTSSGQFDEGIRGLMPVK